jgi:hypothetical protein
MSHAAGCAQRCAQCGEDTNQYLNHQFPRFFLHKLFVFCHTEITEIHRNLFDKINGKVGAPMFL